MKFLFLEEFIKLLVHQCDKNPELFVAFFNNSDLLIGYNYCCSKNRFTHVSNSFQKILGYHQDNILCNDNFSSNIIHPQDRQYLNEYLNVKPVLRSKFSYLPNCCNVNRIKCRAKHIKGYWKYFIIFSIDYRNSKSNLIDKIGLIATEHVKHLQQLISYNMDSTFLCKFISERNYLSRELIKINDKITPREIEILELISEGMTAKEIAKGLNISLFTVITHRKNLISKFQVHNTAELIKRATNLMMV